MRLLGRISEDEMITVFLRGELESERFGDKLRAMLGTRELDDVDEACRRALLEDHRAYESRDGLFGGFPRDVDWYRAELTRDEVLDILFIDWSWWLELSGGTRSAREAARRIRAGELTRLTAEVTPDEHEPYLTSPSELIAVTTPTKEKLVLVEGHVRLTAYALFPNRVPDALEILLGIAEDMANWCQF
jgi:hypothetical protein